MASSIGYINRQRPRVAVMENVSGLLAKKFASVLKGTVRALESMGYVVYHPLLNSADFRLPQVRKRVFLVAIRSDSKRADFVWPEPMGSVKVAPFLDPPTAADKPGRLPNFERGKERCISVYQKVYRDGVDPRTTPVLVDVDCSGKFLKRSTLPGHSPGAAGPKVALGSAPAVGA
eukprot:NODE_100_length_2129_cov_2.147059.p1 GENE.NODE_100_length_2129_cov_2.147059~~NODE_100_length_2129_cov_2.147059.p1  ORF type:complete len:175 (-),score=15.97 NODE_100_length_2129_cov_2.147059:630-1154(-)